MPGNTIALLLTLAGMLLTGLLISRGPNLLHDRLARPLCMPTGQATG